MNTPTAQTTHNSPDSPLPNTFPLTWRPKYPHLRPDETLIWNTFLRAISDPSITVSYDVHVGTLPTAHRNAPPAIQKHIEAVYPKKIDAAIFLPTITAIVELKPYAGLSAIGQALSYTHLFARQYPGFPSPKPFILTDRPQLDIPELCRHFHITLWTFQDLGKGPKVQA